MRIVFFGTPQFAKTILEYLVEQNIEIAAIVTRPDQLSRNKKKPIPIPVKEFALSKNLPLYQPQKASDPEFVSFLKTLNADLFIVAAYAEILKENVLETPRLGCVNVHPSLLPKYRGAAPVQRSVMAGEKETAVTIMKMAKELDAGDMLAVVKTPIPPDMTAGELDEMLARLGREALWKVMQEIEKGTAKPIKQNPQEATYAKKLTTEEGEVDWSKAGLEVYNHIRGVTPKPGAWCWVEIRGKKKRLGLRKTRLEPTLGGNPGEILSKSPYELVVACQSGAIKMLEVVLEGKKTMSVEAFLKGYSLQELKF